MNLGIVADEIDRNFANAVRIGKELGIRRYEVRHLRTGRFPMVSAEEISEVAHVAASEDIEITGISPGLFKLTDSRTAFDREMDEVYSRSAEWALRWGLKGLIVFGFHRPGATEENASSLPRRETPPQVVEWLQESGERAASDGLQLMIEPEPICWADTSAATAALIRATKSGAIRINYDPGNVAWLWQRDPIEEFSAASEYISNVHIKDLHCTAPGSARPRFVAAGEGIVDWLAHLTALRDAGYDGPLTLEPHMDGNSDTIRQCRDAVERLAAQLL